MSRASVAEARLKVCQAEDALASEIEKTHPPGSRVAWDRRGQQLGTVIHCGKNSLRVRNDRTMKSYWIDLFFVYGPSN